jgi:hypothetical protein
MTFKQHESHIIDTPGNSTRRMRKMDTTLYMNKVNAHRRSPSSTQPRTRITATTFMLPNSPTASPVSPATPASFSGVQGRSRFSNTLRFVDSCVYAVGKCVCVNSYTNRHEPKLRTSRERYPGYLRLLSRPRFRSRADVTCGLCVLLVGLDGCEVRLCGPCAFVRPRVPCVPCVSRLPRCLFTGTCIA